MEPESGLFRAGRILLLVGGILSIVGLFTFLILFLFFLTFKSEAASTPFGAGFMKTLMGTFATLGVAGAFLTFAAFGRAKRGDPRGAFVLGLIGSLLPPVQIPTLIGAIFCRVSEEGERASPQAAGSPPPA